MVAIQAIPNSRERGSVVALFLGNVLVYCTALFLGNVLVYCTASFFGSVLVYCTASFLGNVLVYCTSSAAASVSVLILCSEESLLYIRHSGLGVSYIYTCIEVVQKGVLSLTVGKEEV